MTHAFETGRGAVFIATLTELREALPGWRQPLATREDRPGRNPFTGEAMLVQGSLDPEPNCPAPIPPRLPFDHVLVPQGAEDWEARYLALDVGLSRDRTSRPDSRESIDAEDPELDDRLSERGLNREALFGGMHEGDPHWLYILPDRLVERLASIEDDDMALELEEWNRRSPSDNAIDDLSGLAALAKRARTEGRAMFAWLPHPTFR